MVLGEQTRPRIEKQQTCKNVGQFLEEYCLCVLGKEALKNMHLTLC